MADRYIVINRKKDVAGLEDQYWVFFRMWWRLNYEGKREKSKELGNELEELKLYINQRRGLVPM